MEQLQPMTEGSVRDMMDQAGARCMSRGGRTDNYGSPREFSFEVKGMFPNRLGLHIVARQYNYRDPWEAEGRVNDLVDVTFLREGQPSPLPKGQPFFQGREEETGVDEAGLREMIASVSQLNPKLFLLQELAGDF
ncbi:MAG: hypothetical protein C0616_12355 [Desulfuromonas sp.]|nr:MAG: hypothetical protein C0616_12355 [Desulfuromonas sp.]